MRTRISYKARSAANHVHAPQCSDDRETEDPEEITKGEKSKGEGEDEEGDEEDEPRSSDKIEQVPTIAPLPLA